MRRKNRADDESARRLTSGDRFFPDSLAPELQGFVGCRLADLEILKDVGLDLAALVGTNKAGIGGAVLNDEQGLLRFNRGLRGFGLEHGFLHYAACAFDALCASRRAREISILAFQSLRLPSYGAPAPRTASQDLQTGSTSSGFL